VAKATLPALRAAGEAARAALEAAPWVELRFELARV
jgi:hypothetical protein